MSDIEKLEMRNTAISRIKIVISRYKAGDTCKFNQAFIFGLIAGLHSLKLISLNEYVGFLKEIGKDLNVLEKDKLYDRS